MDNSQQEKKATGTTMEEAAAKKTLCLEDVIKECGNAQEKLNAAIQETNQVETDLGIGFDQAQKSLVGGFDKVRKRLDDGFHTAQKQLADEKTAKEQRLKAIGQELHGNLAKVESLCQVARKLAESGSDFEKLANYASIMETLQEASSTNAIAADAELAHIAIPSLPYLVIFKGWEKVREFSTLDAPRGDNPYGIVITPDNDMAVRLSNVVKVFSQAGVLKHKFTVPSGFNIANMQDGKYVISGYHVTTCYVYDTEGKELMSFTPTCDPNIKPSSLRPVAIDSQGNIIVGSEPGTVAVHTSDGTLVSKFKVNGEPRHLAVTKDGSIAVTTTNPEAVQLFDPAGNLLKTLPQPDGVTQWAPVALCCSKRGELFVTNHGAPKGVYTYKSDGEYLGCVTTESGVSWGIAMSHDDQELMVVDNGAKIVKIFQRL